MAVNRDKFTEPSLRGRPVSALVDGKVCVWGGDTVDTSDANHCYHFDPLSESWSQSDCIGPTPELEREFAIAACASAGHHLYVYGERDEKGDSSFHQLDLRTNTWRMISSDGPSMICGCGLTVYDSSSNLLLIGGEDEDGNITDKIHTFNLKEGEEEVISSRPHSHARISTHFRSHRIGKNPYSTHLERWI